MPTSEVDARTRAEMPERALQIWDSSASWIAGLRPDHHAQARHTALARLGRETLMAHDARHHATAFNQLERWRRARPCRLTDAQKLLAAVYLMSRPDLA